MITISILFATAKSTIALDKKESLSAPLSLVVKTATSEFTEQPVEVRERSSPIMFMTLRLLHAEAGRPKSPGFCICNGPKDLVSPRTI